MKIKNKRAMEGGIWWIIMGVVVAVVVAGIILYITKGGLFASKENIDALASCTSQRGACEPSCGPDKDSYFKFGGCPNDGDTITNDNYCCIPKQT